MKVNFDLLPGTWTFRLYIVFFVVVLEQMNENNNNESSKEANVAL